MKEKKKTVLKTGYDYNEPTNSSIFTGLHKEKDKMHENLYIYIRKENNKHLKYYIPRDFICN